MIENRVMNIISCKHTGPLGKIEDLLTELWMVVNLLTKFNLPLLSIRIVKLPVIRKLKCWGSERMRRQRFFFVGLEQICHKLGFMFRTHN